MGVVIKKNLEISEYEWDGLISLFRRSSSKNPFISPGLLKDLYCSWEYSLAYVLEGESMILYLPLKLSGNTVMMAGESGSDDLDIIYEKGLSTTIIYKSLFAICERLSAKNIIFKKFGSEKYSSKIIKLCLKKQDYNLICFNTWERPYLRFDKSQKELIYRKHFQTSKIRNSIKKLNRPNETNFEIIEHYDLIKVTKWVESFCNIHEIRWNGTNTPSIYSNKNNRDTLLKKVSVWLYEGIAVLFTLQVDGIKLGMAICLKTEGRLIYHHIAINRINMYKSFPSNRILLAFIGDWLIGRDYSVLDFGIGNEEYKTSITKSQNSLIRIYSSKSVLSKCSITGNIDMIYHKYNFLQIFLNKIIREKGVYRIGRFLSDLRTKTSWHFKHFEFKSLVNKINKRISGERYYFYYIQVKDQVKIEVKSNYLKFCIPDQKQVMAFYREETIFTYNKRKYYLALLENKYKQPYSLIDSSGKIVSIGWLAKPEENEIPPSISNITFKVIDDCFTAHSFRGLGYYSLLIKSIILQNKDSVQNYVMYTNDWNKASQRAILKSGFQFIAIRGNKGKKLSWKELKGN